MVGAIKQGARAQAVAEPTTKHAAVLFYRRLSEKRPLKNIKEEKEKKRKEKKRKEKKRKDGWRLKALEDSFLASY